MQMWTVGGVDSADVDRMEEWIMQIWTGWRSRVQIRTGWRSRVQMWTGWRSR
jgi:hypothetical protein